MEVRNVVCPMDMVTRPRYQWIPKFGHWVALQEYQDHLIDIDDHIADADEVQQPHQRLVLARLRAILNAQEKSYDGYLAKPDRLHNHDLTDPGPEIRFHELWAEEEVEVVAEAGEGGDGDHTLCNKGCDLVAC